MSEQPTDEVLVEPEPLDPADTGVGATGTATVTPAPGSDSTAQAAPSEALTYVERAQSALMQAFGSVPSMVILDGEMLARLTVLVLVKGDRCTPSDVHDSWATWAHMRGEGDGEGGRIVPFDALTPKEQQGLDNVTAAVQKAGRFMGRDGS